MEKISSLKKNNAELANIARKLEGKARILQEQNVKVGAGQSVYICDSWASSLINAPCCMVGVRVILLW